MVKINLRTIALILSNKELKNVLGGSGYMYVDSCGTWTPWGYAEDTCDSSKCTSTFENSICVLLDTIGPCVCRIPV